MAKLDEIQRALAQARAGLRAPEAARERVRARLGALALASNALDAAPESVAPESVAPESVVPESVVPHLERGAGMGLAKLVRHPVSAWLAAALTGGGFGAGYWLGAGGQHAAPGAAVAVRQSEPLRALSPPAAVVVAPVPELAPALPRRAASEALVPPRAPRPVAQERGLSAELTLLQRAERAIRSDNSALALVLLDELDHAFPQSALREERRVARLLAECQQEQPWAAGVPAQGSARARAAQFLLEQSGSVYSDRIGTLCGVSAANAAHAGEGSGSSGH